MAMMKLSLLLSDAFLKDAQRLFAKRRGDQPCGMPSLRNAPLKARVNVQNGKDEAMDD